MLVVAVAAVLGSPVPGNNYGYGYPYYLQVSRFYVPYGNVSPLRPIHLGGYGYGHSNYGYGNNAHYGYGNHADYGY